MHQVNIHEAKTNLSKLIEEAIQGEPFIIAKAGKPLVKVTAISNQSEKKVNRLGFMKNQIAIPKDFDTCCQKDIEDLFNGNV